MKKLLIAVLLFVGLQNYGQIVTSEDEYNYLTKGYPLSLETGQDIKAGYEIEKFFEKSFGDYSFTYSFLNEISSKKAKAVLIVAKKEKGKNDKLIYMCLPFNNGSLMKKAISEKVGGVMMLEVFEQVNYILLSKSLDRLKNNPGGKIQE